MEDLRAVIADRILAQGPISFAEYMDLALYHPTLGYYARASQRTGRAGDFFTSVDVGPIFGELLAIQLDEMWRLLEQSAPHSAPSRSAEPEARPFDLVEAGAGSGRLARDILEAASKRVPEFYAALRLHLVDRSPAARAAQRTTLGPHANHLSTSGSSLPVGIRGVILANELLDALPTHVVTMTEAGLREIFVVNDRGRLVERPGPPSTPEIADYLRRTGITLEPGWRVEINLAALDWMRTAARALQQGFLLIIDYGHEQAELYSPSHSSGTLTPFYRHTTGIPGAADSEPLAACLAHPGECDITAHVDLTAITRAAEEEGLVTLARLDQTYFLIGLGLPETIDRNQGPGLASLRQRMALKTLMLPGGLGSTHKVLIFGKGIGTPRLKGCSYRERLT